MLKLLEMGWGIIPKCPSFSGFWIRVTWPDAFQRRIVWCVHPLSIFNHVVGDDPQWCIFLGLVATANSKISSMFRVLQHFPLHWSTRVAELWEHCWFVAIPPVHPCPLAICVRQERYIMVYSIVNGLDLLRNTSGDQICTWTSPKLGSHKSMSNDDTNGSFCLGDS